MLVLDKHSAAFISWVLIKHMWSSEIAQKIGNYIISTQKSNQPNFNMLVMSLPTAKKEKFEMRLWDTAIT